MKNKKNSLSLILIASSLALVLALQVLWLSSAYRDAKLELSREVNQLFRSTVFAMQDSLIQKNIVPFKGDSLREFPPRFFAFRDSMHFPITKDSAVNYWKMKNNSIKVEVYSSSKVHSDSSDRAVRAIISKATQLQTKGGSPKNFIIRLGVDSLRIDSLTSQFRYSMKNSKIDLPFSIFKNLKKQNSKNGTLQSETVSINPITSYTSTISGIHAYLWKKIAPQILFSIFSTLLTSLSFVVLYRSLRSQQQLMEMKNSFIGNITHELKTPISTVSVALEALKDFNALSDPKRTEEYLSMAQNELSRLTLLTDNVLKMTTLEGRKLALMKENFEFSQIVERILQSMKLIFQKQNVSVSFSKEGDNFEIYGSEVHLTNVVYNLIDNALKYSAQNSAIIIHLSSSSSQLVLSVKDNGIGIAKEFHKKIFEKFFRVPTGNVHNAHGYGLGLNYVAEVIGQHNGRIEVESEPGLGSKFTLIFPKHQP